MKKIMWIVAMIPVVVTSVVLPVSYTHLKFHDTAEKYQNSYRFKELLDKCFISHRCMQMFFLWRVYGITPQR